MERDHKPGNRGPIETGKGKKTDSPQGIHKGMPSCQHLDLIQWDPIWTSDPQKCKVISLCQLKSLNVWYFVTAAKEN